MANATEANAGLGGDLSPRVAAMVHPIYDLLKQQWIDLANVREGIGGFLDGTYLRAHPREWLDHTSIQVDQGTGASVARLNPNPKQPSPKLKARRLLARYENIASSIIQATKAVLFKDAPTRRLDGLTGQKDTESPIELWWQNVDGKGTEITDAMRKWWDVAATFGHVWLYFCKDQPPGATTAADETLPYIRVYTPLDVLNWLVDDDGNITSVKVMEAVPPQDFNTLVTTYLIRVIDTEGSTVYNYKTGKKAVEYQPHGLGRLPFVPFFAKRRSIFEDIGESVLGDPKNYIDLYNLTSEIRELLRNQTFSFINLPLGTGPDAMTVEAAQAMMGKQTGTMNVLFSAQPAQILTGDSTNIKAYHDEIERTKREIYRETGVQWDADTRSAEARGSLQIKREEMTTRIGLYADECQKTELALADCFYRAQYGADRGPTKLEEDKLTVHYATEVQSPIGTTENMLERAQAAESLGFPPEVMKAIRKQFLRTLIPADSPEELFTELDAAIDAAQDPTPADLLKAKITALAQPKGAFGQKPPADANSAAIQAA